MFLRFLDAVLLVALVLIPSGSFKNSQYFSRNFVTIFISDKLRMSRNSCVVIVCRGHVGKLFIWLRTSGRVVVPLFGLLYMREKSCLLFQRHVMFEWIKIQCDLPSLSKVRPVKNHSH